MEPEQGPLGVRVKLGHLLVGEDFPLQSRPALKKLPLVPLLLAEACDGDGAVGSDLGDRVPADRRLSKGGRGGKPRPMNRT